MPAEQSPTADSGRVIEVLIVDGVEGPSVYLDGTRIAGNKPWGGGNVIAEWQVELADILTALPPSPNGRSEA